MSQQGELQGFINVKIPSSMKSRNFIPWKTWKRQWVVVRRSRLSRNGVELLIGRNSGNIFQITTDDVICRTESRTQHYAFGVFSPQSKRRANIYLSGTSETDSQKWIYTIRKLLKPPLLPVEEDEFSVAIIDNMFSRSAGFSGLYGTLRVGLEQVTIVDPFTSKNKVEWPWAGLSQFHVSSTIAKEDKGHVCTIVTSRLFPAGVGQIYLYCQRAVELTMKLQVKGKSVTQLTSPERGFVMPYRHHTFSCTCTEKQDRVGSSLIPLSASQAALGKSSPIPRSFLLSRRLSRSEGNLLSVLREMNTGPYGFLGSGNCINSFTEESCNSEDKTLFESNEYFTCKGKIAPGIVSAGLGLILSTPGGSEADNESLHEYQRLQKGDSDDELTFLSLTVPASKLSSPRRESGVSIASGVYEEIDDVSTRLDCTSLDIVTEDEFESPPPPLPPRREPSYINIDETEYGNGYINTLPVPQTVHEFLSKSEGNSPLRSPIPLAKSRTVRSSAEVLCLTSSSWNGSEDSDYLPMLPSCGFSKRHLKADFIAKDSLEEQHYMVMASIKST